MPRVRPLTLARGFKFQTASHEFSLTFFRALHCSQTEHAHKRLSIPHADTVTEAMQTKVHVYSNYLRVRLGARVKVVLLRFLPRKKSA